MEKRIYDSKQRNSKFQLINLFSLVLSQHTLYKNDAMSCQKKVIFTRSENPDPKRKIRGVKIMC